MRPTTAAAHTIRTLVAAVPDDRLREIFLALALAALAGPAVEKGNPLRATDGAVGAAAAKVAQHRHAFERQATRAASPRT